MRMLLEGVHLLSPRGATNKRQSIRWETMTPLSWFCPLQTVWIYDPPPLLLEGVWNLPFPRQLMDLPLLPVSQMCCTSPTLLELSQWALMITEDVCPGDVPLFNVSGPRVVPRSSRVEDCWSICFIDDFGEERHAMCGVNCTSPSLLELSQWALRTCALGMCDCLMCQVPVSFPTRRGSKIADRSICYIDEFGEERHANLELGKRMSNYTHFLAHGPGLEHVLGLFIDQKFWQNMV